MPERVESGLLRELFVRVGGLLPGRARLVVVGGSAMALLGNPRTTVDFDFIGDDAEPDELTRLILKTAGEMKIPADPVPMDRFIPLPEGGAEREIPVGTFGNLEVTVADPYSIALSKLGRGFDTDLDDVAFLIRRGHVRPDPLERAVRESEPRAAEFELDTAEMLARLRIAKTRAA